MKILSKLAFAAFVISIAVTSCKKSTKATTPVGPLGPTYPYALNNVVTPTILDTLKKHGVVINDGLTPPTANGIVLLSPDSCTYDNSGLNTAGDIYDDYAFKFSNQNNAASTIRVDYKDEDFNDLGSDTSATYISGTGSSFTIYAK